MHEKKFRYITIARDDGTGQFWEVHLDFNSGTLEVTPREKGATGGLMSHWLGHGCVLELHDPERMGNGEVDADAQAALEELQEAIYACERLPEGWGYWPASDALQDYQLSPAEVDLATTQGVGALVQRLRDECMGYGMWVEEAELHDWVTRQLAKKGR